MNREITIRTINNYGVKQLGIVTEELAELIQAISKYKRSLEGDYNKSTAVEMICEEMADVYIMLDQLKYLIESKEGYQIDNRIEEYIQFKQIRTKAKLDAAAEKILNEDRTGHQVKDLIGKDKEGLNISMGTVYNKIQQQIDSHNARIKGC